MYGRVERSKKEAIVLLSFWGEIFSRKFFLDGIVLIVLCRYIYWKKKLFGWIHADVYIFGILCVATEARMAK